MTAREGATSEAGDGLHAEARAPEREPAPRISAQAHAAGGPQAVFSSFKLALGQMRPWRAARGLATLNQKAGYDCPGCAWPDPDDRRSMVEFCENGAKAIAEEGTARRADRALFAARSIAELSRETDFEIGKLGRLTEPFYKREGGTHYEPIAWDDAFALIARELRSLASPDRAVFYTSGRTSNEAAFLYQLLVRLYGTNNLPDCSNMCHESSGVGLTETIGVGKGTVTLADFDHADCIVVIGQNPGTNHPRMLTALLHAARRGCQIVSINPLREAGLSRFKHPQEVRGWLGRGTPLARLHLPVRVGGDVALLKGVMKEWLERGLPRDQAFTDAKTMGYAAFEADLRAESWDRIVAESGIPRAGIAGLTEVLAGAKRLIVCWAMGLTQHRNAVGNIQSVVNLLLLGGHFGRPGAGACPVRGHSNVQGDRTMGIWERPGREFLDRLAGEFRFEPPRAHGLDVVNAIRAMDDGRVDVFFAMGGNFLSATPDTEVVARALERCRLTVHVSTKPNRAHLITGRQALILPCLGRSEEDFQRSGRQFVTVENSMGVVHSSHGKLKPASPELRSEVAILAGLGRALFAALPVEAADGDVAKVETANAGADLDWPGFAADYDRIRERIARVVPGFEDFVARVRHPGGFYLFNPVRDRCEFPVPGGNGRARFTVHPIPETRLPGRRYRLMTVRSHDQFNTTLYGLNDRYRGVTQGRRVLFMNEEDVKERGFAEGNLVDISSHFGAQSVRTVHRFAVIPYEIPRGCLAAYFPECNPLVPLESIAEKSQTPTYKSIEVSLTPSEGT